MQGWPEIRKILLFSHVGPTCQKASRRAGLAAQDATTILAFRAATPAWRPTILLLYYLRSIYGVGRPRCKKVFASRAATLRYPAPTTDYRILPRVPRTTRCYHVLPRTTMYYHVLPRITLYYDVLILYQILIHVRDQVLN